MKKLLTITSLVLLASCGQQKVNIKDEEEKIVQCWTDWPKKAISGDPTYYFADNAIMMGQEQPTFKGKEDISKFYASMPKIPGLQVKWNDRPNIIEFSQDGQMAYSVDTLKLSVTDKTGTVQTKVNQGLHVWKKDNEGNWRVTLLSLYSKK
jgi:ketosteroid isomerase-like protein